MAEKRIYYRVITPDSFANLNRNSLIEAVEAKKEFGTCKSERYKEYWAEMEAKCEIARVTEIVEIVINKTEVK